MMNQYDEIKNLLKKSRLLTEAPSPGPINLAKDIEKSAQQGLEKDQETTTEKNKKYRISGGILSIHGDNSTETALTTDDKIAFQETMDEFVNEVSDLVDFNKLNVYPNNVEWSGKIIDFDIEFFFSIGEDGGMYINGDMIKADENFVEMINKLKTYYDKFKSKWAKVLASRKKTNRTEQ